LGSFATWQAERAVGDHDRNTLRLRLDPQGDVSAFEPGMTVWFQSLSGAAATHLAMLVSEAVRFVMLDL